MHNQIVKKHIMHILAMCSHLSDTRQWAERRLWLRRLRFWWKIRHKSNKQVIMLLVDLQRRGEHMIGVGNYGYDV